MSESTVREMMWHIYGPEHYPLCWDDMALEFDSEESARVFLASAIANSEHDADFYSEAVISEDILYYDGGYLNASNYVVYWDAENCETYLADKNEVLKELENN